MLIKPLYDAFLKRYDSESPLMRSDRNKHLLTPVEFLRLPYQHRLKLAGASIRLRRSLCFNDPLTGAHFFPVNELVAVCGVPDILFDGDQIQFPLDWNEFYLQMGGDYHMLFPFEYEIVLE